MSMCDWCRETDLETYEINLCWQCIGKPEPKEPKQPWSKFGKFMAFLWSLFLMALLAVSAVYWSLYATGMLCLILEQQ